MTKPKENTLRILSVSYGWNIDHTRIKYTDSFKNTDWITKVDVLKDVIKDLQYQYQSILAVKIDDRDTFIIEDLK